MTEARLTERTIEQLVQVVFDQAFARFGDVVVANEIASEKRSQLRKDAHLPPVASLVDGGPGEQEREGLER